MARRIPEITGLALAALYFAAPANADDDLGSGFKCEYQYIQGREIRNCGYEKPKPVVHWECIETLYKSNFPFYTGFQKICYPLEWTIVQQDEFY